MKDLRAQGDAYKGPDAVRNVCYFEVNDTNPLNALEFVLKDSGKLFFDDIILFRPISITMRKRDGSMC